MILPIVAYGENILKTKAVNISSGYPELKKLINDMWETMYNANGVGIAAPQIGKSIRLFVIDASPFSEDKEISDDEISTLKNFKKVFINPEIIDETGDEWNFMEGCLSIPNIREDIKRKEKITIKYYNESFEEIELDLEGLAARVVQHEYDHIEGVLFIDKLSSLKKKLLKGKLNDISKGKIKTEYKMRYPQGKIKR
ncbi:MAG: peptide deformylase [Flavobacteriaceae bacterium TMED121]|nr:MAG: peptide deformylase [Flavobacteriaceae bacterium TMED121]|tara:strand:+ start:1323 stop:1913 length:591 start_codon:yes stop_codon:yes gene_type:complete